ncbi:MAG: hypothetical protein AB7D07_00295 [Desulfovibrionaceae bacterium]
MLRNVVRHKSMAFQYSGPTGDSWISEGASVTFRPGAVYNDASSSAVRSIATATGDFYFACNAYTNVNEVIFGVYDISGDGSFSSTSYIAGLNSITNSYWFQFYPPVSTYLFKSSSAILTNISAANGSRLKIERVGTNLSMYADGTLVHNFESVTSTLRFVIGLYDATDYVKNISWSI